MSFVYYHIDSCISVSFCFQKMTIMVIHIDRKNMNYSSMNLLHTFAETFCFKCTIWLTGVGGGRRPVLAEGYCNFSLEDPASKRWGNRFEEAALLQRPTTIASHMETEKNYNLLVAEGNPLVWFHSKGIYVESSVMTGDWTLKWIVPCHDVFNLQKPVRSLCDFNHILVLGWMDSVSFSTGNVNLSSFPIVWRIIVPCTENTSTTMDGHIYQRSIYGVYNSQLDLLLHRNHF